MTAKPNEIMEAFIFIKFGKQVVGMEVLDGTFNLDTELRVVPSDDIFVQREPTGVKHVQLRGEMGNSQVFEKMPNYKKTDRKVLKEASKECSKYALFCPHCGFKSQNPANSYVCFNCGKDVGPAELRTIDEMSADGKRKLCHNGTGIAYEANKHGTG
jgi:rubrerythrin